MVPVYGRSPAAVVGSNPTLGGMDVCLLCVFCVVRYRSPRRANHSSKRSPTDCGASLCVITKSRGQGGHESMGRWAAPVEKTNFFFLLLLILLILFVGPAESRLMHCSLPRLILLTPLFGFPVHLQRRSTSERRERPISTKG
jgi:hypothetical protein